MSTKITTVEEGDIALDQALESIVTLAENMEDGEKLLELTQILNPETKGIEGQTRTRLPMVAIRQKMSTSDAIPSDCDVGDMYTTMADNLGNEIVIVPVLTHDIRRKWGDDGIDCASLDAQVGSKYGECRKCPYGKYVEGQPMECAKGTRYYALTEDMNNLYQIDFMKTSAKAGRTIRRLSRPPALWGRKFKLTTEKQKANKGEYYTYEVSVEGNTDAETRKIADAIYDYLKPMYEQAKVRQADWARFNSGDGNTITADTKPTPEVTSSEDDVPDFSDGL